MTDYREDYIKSIIVRKENNILSAIICIALFLLFNPFLALFFLAILSVYVKINKPAFFIFGIISFALIFYFRKFGIEANNRSDDTDVYLKMYHDNKSIPFFEIFTRFFSSPNGNEPLYHLIWWPFINWLDASDKLFLFCHYVVIFSALFFSLYLLSERFFIIIILVFFFITPAVLDTVAFVWRQQLAFSMFLIGIGFFFSERKIIGNLIIYLSPLMHLSAIFFVFIFFAYQIYRKTFSFDKKYKFIFFIVLLYLLLAITFGRVIIYLDDLGLERVLNYFTDNNDSMGLIILSSIVYSVLLFSSYLFLKNDKLNVFFIATMMSVFCIMIAFPSATGIWSRFSIFSLPFFGIYFYRIFLMNFSLRWNVLIVLFIFLSGLFRMYRSYVGNGGGILSLLAYNHADDPFMGIIKMLVSFIKL